MRRDVVANGANVAMRAILLVARGVAILYLPVLLLGWMWFDVAEDGPIGQALSVVPIAALGVAALGSERWLSRVLVKWIVMTLCMIGAVQYLYASISSLSPTMGPDYYAFAKQLALVVVLLLLSIRVYRAHSQNGR